MVIWLVGDFAPLRVRRKLRDCRVETVEVTEEVPAEMAPRAHLAKVDLLGEESCALLGDFERYVVIVIVICYPLSSRRFPDPHLPPQIVPAPVLDHHRRSSCAIGFSSAPSHPWIGFRAWLMTSSGPETLLIYSSSQTL